MSQVRSYSTPDIHFRFGPIEHKNAEDSNSLRESGLNFELGAILDQIIEDY